MEIQRVLVSFILCSALSVSAVAFAQAGQPAKPPIGAKVPPAQVYSALLSRLEKEVVDAAEAMPEDRYDFAPTQGEFKGVRTFSSQVKHLAQANYHIWGAFAGSSADDGAYIDKLTTKADIVKALKDSFVMAHKAVDSITADNAFEMTKTGTRAGMTTSGLAHLMDHYGQMVEYLRMNGIVPPASRGSN